MIISSPDDEITGTEDIININHVKERIPNIFPWHVEDETATDLGSFITERGAVNFIGDRAGLTAIEYPEDTAELEALKALLSDLGNVSDDSYLINDGYLEEYAQEDSSGEISEDSPLFMFVNWKAVADAYKLDMLPVTFRGSDYWVKAR